MTRINEHSSSSNIASKDNVKLNNINKKMKTKVKRMASMMDEKEATIKKLSSELSDSKLKFWMMELEIEI